MLFLSERSLGGEATVGPRGWNDPSLKGRFLKRKVKLQGKHRNDDYYEDEGGDEEDEEFGHLRTIEEDSDGLSEDGDEAGDREVPDDGIDQDFDKLMAEYGDDDLGYIDNVRYVD